MTKAPQAFSQAPPASPPAPASGPRPAPACSAGRPGSSLPLLDRRPSSVPHAQRWRIPSAPPSVNRRSELARPNRSAPIALPRATSDHAGPRRERRAPAR